MCFLFTAIALTLAIGGAARADGRPYFAVPAAAPPAVWQATVDYQTPGATLGEVLTEVAAQTGVQVMAHSQYLQTPVAMRIKGQPLREFLEDLARLLRCKWRLGGEVLLLSPLSAVALPPADAPEVAFDAVLKELIASLSPQQRATLDAGTPLSFASLLPEQQVMLSTLFHSNDARRPPLYYADGSLVTYPEEGWEIIEYVAENDVWELSMRATAPSDPQTGHGFGLTSHFTHRGPLAPKLEPLPEEESTE